MSSGYFLVFHGSRDRRPELLLSKLIQFLDTRIADESILTQSKDSKQQASSEVDNDISNYTGKTPSTTTNVVDILAEKEISLVCVGSLELTTVSLPKNIEKYAHSLQKLGCKHLKILPLFLVPGVHVCKDIPTEILPLQNDLASDIKIELLPYLGSYPQTLAMIGRQFDSLSNNNGRILFTHGTSYPGGNEWLENLANQLDACIAYYSIRSSLQKQIERLVSQQKQKITIIPYFIFPGRITDAIASLVTRLQQSFPDTELCLGKPLGTTEEFTNLIVDILSI